MLASQTNAASDYTLLDYLAIVRKRWIWVLLPVVALTAMAAAWTVTRPPVYQTSARVLLADSASQATLDPNSQSGGSRELPNEISLAHSDLVEAMVSEELGGLPAIDITAASSADVLVFSATASTAEAAALHANTWAEQYMSVKRDEAVADIAAATTRLQDQLRDLRTERERLREPLDEIDDEISRTEDPIEQAVLQRQYDRLADSLRYELELVTGQAEGVVKGLTALELEAESAAVGEARMIQVAAPPRSTTNAPLSRNLALGVTVGLMVGFGLALVAENRDSTIKNAGDIAAVTDLPVLASIPEADRRDMATLATATHSDPEGSYANGYHKVRSSLEFASLDVDLRTVLITSAGASEGKSTSSSNLALAFASVGKRTVLLDVDFRRARIHDIYGVPRAPGLTDVTLHGVDMGAVAYGISEPGLENLLVVPSGTPPPNPAAFVGTAGFAKAVEWVRNEAEVVVLDAPPMLAVSDPHTMATRVDAVVLTARAGRTTKGELLEAVTALGQVGANLLGVILIGVDESETYGRYYYYRSDRTDGQLASRGSTANLWSRRMGTTSIDVDLRDPQTVDPRAVSGPIPR